MNVEYVTIQFPVPPETFATNEVRVLRELDVRIIVHGLRPSHPLAQPLLRERGLEGVVVTHNGLGPSLRGVLAGLLRPKLLAQALGWIVRSNHRNWRDAAVSLALLPRAFDILSGIERRRPDVVHMYWGHFPTIVGFLVQHSLREVVTSVSIVAYDLEREYGGAPSVAVRADVIRTHARVNAERLARFTGVPPDQINVIYNGVDLRWLERVRDRNVKARHRIVVAGRLTERKGMREALRVFARVLERWPTATLVMLGDGPDRPVLEKLRDSLGLGTTVELMGHVPHERVVRELAKAEVFMLLSRSEGERLPNAVKEAMACGCICITTPTPGISELVTHGVTGFVIDAADVDRATHVIDDVFAGRVDTQTLVNSAREHISATFDLYATAPRFTELWDAAIRSRQASRSGRQRRARAT